EKSDKVTYKGLCVTIGLGNLLSFILGGMPLCHGAGGLAAHYRFGARTAGSNLIIGLLLILLVVFFKEGALTIIYLMPMAFLGVLLIFAGSQLAMTILDIHKRKDLFVVVMILGITLVTNLSYGMVIGLLLAYLLKSDRLNI
ncbi:MAG: sulfate permease, partial [Desulfobacteraceae bacterium]|nr:sulfate permease [Desulfobacteraceae bacterium]